MEESNKKINPVEEKRLEIISYIKKYIKKNKLTKDSPLPSENTLAKQFNVNRNIVRSALSHLKSQGYIYSIKGKGFFIKQKIMTVVFEHSNEIGFSELLKENDTYRTELLKWDKGVAGPHECKIFGISQGEEVYRIKILRFIEGLPLAVCYSILPERLVSNMEEHFDGFRSVNEILMNIYGYEHPKCDSVSIEATFASTEEVKLLEISDSVPILKQVSVFSIKEGVVEYFIVRARGDRFRFNMNFKEEGVHPMKE